MNIELTKEQLREALIEQMEIDSLLELLKELSDAYGDLEVDLQIADFFLKRVMKYKDNLDFEDYPELRRYITSKNLTTEQINKLSTFIDSL